MKGYFILTYSKINGHMISLDKTDIRYVFIDFNEFFYLIPINALPIRKDLSIKTGFRMNIDSDFSKYIYNYSFVHWLYSQCI